MKEKDHIYAKAIEELRELSPQLERPEELTGKIIREVGKIPQNVRPKLFPLLSGIAATLLLCLWGYEILRYRCIRVQLQHRQYRFLPPYNQKRKLILFRKKLPYTRFGSKNSKKTKSVKNCLFSLCLTRKKQYHETLYSYFFKLVFNHFVERL